MHFSITVGTLSALLLAIVGALVFAGAFLVGIHLATAIVWTGRGMNERADRRVLDRPAARQMQSNPLQADPGAKGPDRDLGAAVNPLA